VQLSLFEQQLHDVDVQLERLRQSDAIRWWGPWSGLADTKLGWVTDRHDLRDRCLTIQDRDRFPSSHCTQILAQTSLEFGDPNLFHGHIMT
jgi:hypothetical protein